MDTREVRAFFVTCVPLAGHIERELANVSSQTRHPYFVITSLLNLVLNFPIG